MNWNGNTAEVYVSDEIQDRHRRLRQSNAWPQTRQKHEPADLPHCRSKSHHMLSAE